jgi:hypothetical protein
VSENPPIDYSKPVSPPIDYSKPLSLIVSALQSPQFEEVKAGAIAEFLSTGDSGIAVNKAIQIAQTNGFDLILGFVGGGELIRAILPHIIKVISEQKR